jgi:hypothetical protein
MKNVRNTLFVATAALAAGLLAALLSGCDGSGSGEDSTGGDAGRADVVGPAVGDAGRSDAVRIEAASASDARATSCQVPTPKFSLNGMVTTKPRSGYWIVETESVPCLSTIAGGGQPTNCVDPVDGFASGLDQPWCRVSVQQVGGSYYLASGYLVCGATGRQIMEGGGLPSFGNWAVCSPSGKFLGWGG